MKDVKRMTIEILKGYKFGDPRSFIPVNSAISVVHLSYVSVTKN